MTPAWCGWVAITVKCTSQIKFYNKLGLKWFCVWFLKLKKTGLPEYLFNMIPQNNHRYNIQPIAEVATSYCKTDVFKYSYFPHTILEWNQLDMQIRRPEYLLSFKKFLLEMGRPTDKPTFNIYQATGLKFLTSLRLKLSFFNEHKFKHNFQNWVNTLCSHSFQTAVMYPEFFWADW